VVGAVQLDRSQAGNGRHRAEVRRLAVRPDQEILTTAHDFYSTHEALVFKAQRSGATLKAVRLYTAPESTSRDEIVSSLAGAITAHTRVVAVTWVHSSTGVKLPIRALADAVADANAGRDPAERVLLCVDGVHGLGVEALDLPGLGCDFFVAGCHKWLFGPRGTGFVWGHPQAWPAATPTIPTFGDASQSSGAMTPGGFQALDFTRLVAQALRSPALRLHARMMHLAGAFRQP